MDMHPPGRFLFSFCFLSGNGIFSERSEDIKTLAKSNIILSLFFSRPDTQVIYIEPTTGILRYNGNGIAARLASLKQKVFSFLELLCIVIYETYENKHAKEGVSKIALNQKYSNSPN
ncbi:hypothetical protein YC2023_111053 [Brassica napus]